MTKKIDYNITCPKCGKAEDVSLYRIIWGETPGNRDKVFNNQINNFNCQDCGKISHVPVAFLYVHQSGSDSFAVWYEPTHDENIDSDIEGYKHLFSPPDNYYVTAPRINDYEELKETIIKFENNKKNVCDVFNIGIPNSISLKKFIKLLETIVGKKANKKYIKKHPGDLTITKSNIKREKNIFNHEIRVPLNKGIEKLVNWHRSYYK